MTEEVHLKRIGKLSTTYAMEIQLEEKEMFMNITTDQEVQLVSDFVL